MIDLDRDGILDILVADLGSFPPTDRPVRQRRLAARQAGRLVRRPSPCSRTSAASPTCGPPTFAATGKLDLVVGVVRLARHRRNPAPGEPARPTGPSPKFVPRVIDTRHGTIHVPVADLNGDGKPDFVALIAQEHETVVAFINEGGGKFRRRRSTPPRIPAGAAAASSWWT